MMDKMKKTALWFFLLNKRFLKKPLFLLLLCLIPLTAFLVRYLPAGGGTLLQVGLATDSEDDTEAEKVIRSLTQTGAQDAVRYIAYSSGDDLRAAVKRGDVQLGFLMPDDLSALIDSYARITAAQSSGALSAIGQALGVSGSDDVDLEEMKKHTIGVICASNDIVTKLEKEQLFGKIYTEFGNAVLKSWMDVHASDFPMDKEQRDAFLDQALSQADGNSSFFHLSYLNGENIEDDSLNRYYLSPLKGLLAAALILICFAACLFLMQDNRKGMFVWMSPAFRPFFHYLYLLIPVIDGGLFAYLALVLSGAVRGRAETAAFFLYLPAAAGFSNLVRVLTRKMTLFSSSIPVVILACLFLTPVFFDLSILPAVQVILPPYLYLKSLHGSVSMLWILVYDLIAFSASVTIDRMENK